MDVQTLHDRILRLKTLLRDANRRAENPIENLDELVHEGYDMESDANKWKRTAHLLKEELDRYKEEERRRSSTLHFLGSPGGNKELNLAEKGNFKCIPL